MCPGGKPPFASSSRAALFYPDSLPRICFGAEIEAPAEPHAVLSQKLVANANETGLR
jgi:hypothetical protein